MAAKPKPDRQLAQVLAAMQTHVGPGRSPLGRWMRQRHDALAEAFADAPPAWAAFATAVAALGITDAEGKPPTAESARQTWYRVRRDVAAARARRRARAAPSLAPDEIAPGVHLVPPEPGSDPPRPRAKLDLRPARPLAEQPAPDTLAPIPAVPGAADADTGAAGTDAAEQLRRVFAAMEAATTPMPKPVS